MSDIYDFEGARRAVDSLASRTPLLPATELSERFERSVFVKAECLQVTGSFKVRGAAARLSALSESERETGVVACSSGNHGRAVAYVAQKLGVPATVCVPEWVDPVKLDGIRGAGAEALLVGETYDEAEAHALRLADETGRPFVSAESLITWRWSGIPSYCALWWLPSLAWEFWCTCGLKATPIRLSRSDMLRVERSPFSQHWPVQICLSY